MAACGDAPSGAGKDGVWAEEKEGKERWNGVTGGQGKGWITPRREVGSDMHAMSNSPSWA